MSNEELYEKMKAGDRSARDELLDNNRGLVFYYSKIVFWTLQAAVLHSS
ncbi:hypothetical protein [Desulfuribacillus alkaliarsenatis]|nr:hypothetical protein [Desulfuribacillus alkaliarsenatis]